MNSIYSINKGINRSIEFRGLKAQYIWYFGGFVIGLMMLFAILYVCGAGTIICLGIVGGSAVYGSIRIFRFSKQYGEHGLMKVLAHKRLPTVLKSYGRKHFQGLAKKDNTSLKAKNKEEQP
jgi:hypothetical protein